MRTYLLTSLLTAGILIPGYSTSIDPPVSKTKQEADRLVAITKPGYYTAWITQKRQPGSVRNGRAPAVDPCSYFNCTTAALPVKLIRFSGERIDETQVRLSWETTEEVNNDYFGVQRSLNPANGFETVATVKGRGTSDRPITYQTIDPNTNTDYTYYRLKQVDVDGTFAYSSIIAVKGGLPLLSVKAFPNPSQQRTLAFQVAGLQTAESITVVVYDAQGKLIYQNDQYLPDANRQLVIPGLKTLQPGTYYLKISSKTQQASTTFILLH